MKRINDPLSCKRVMDSLKKKTRAKNKFILVMVPFLTLLSTFSNTINEEKLYNEMELSFNDSKTIEYGSEFKALDYVDKVESGEVIFTGSVDTSKLGNNKVIYVVSNGNVKKEFYKEIEVIDTVGADISIKKDDISIYTGDDYDVLSNIDSVKDQVDGDLSYKKEVTDNDKGYYTIVTDFNNNVAGNYSVNIKAIDNSGNVSEKSYNISVKDRPIYTYSYTNSNVSATVDTTSVVSAAYSFLGYRYTYAGASPETGFDCTGFVYYIYGLFGKKVGRSSSDIIYSGTGVSIDNMQPGDIIVWSTRADNGPTHAALYVGDGMMIHAANPSQGVILSSIEGWARSSHIVAVRRV